ncbi:5'-nucleotidase C-terminal domain-containing protein [Hymenobacter cellulosivorans]|uniref:5'-nucleotidase C-terminal domain-containing protein n=1 Tax=Hymenobacter cellulosivorans TaxID=2932249 RepID=A0ABY4F8A0_9BACT|nr:5'-nucleotidase C-terminal domain-containing protein [Hymenobacter cellulosivorans]UOQ52884.1 5'-nucleotidase C-terminal domain-containing protein [Hymenobacter cellulosivorans]
MSFPRPNVSALSILLAASLTFGCQRGAYQATPALAPVTGQPVTKALPEDPKATATIEPYKQRVTQQMTEVLGVAPVAITKNGGESPLANLVADVQRERASQALGQPIDAGVMTNGGLRAALPAGPITMGSIFELMPFENELVVLDTPGPVMQEMLNYAARIKMALSNVTYTVADGKPTNVLIGGKPFDPTRTYTIAISDYLAGGGDQMVFFKAIKPRSTGVLLRTAIVDHIRSLTKAGKPVEAKVEGRVKVM